MRKILMSLLCIGLALGQLYAQSRTISGRITDNTGNPLVGATVAIVGGSGSTTTNAGGSFSLNAPAGANELEVTYVGFATQRITIGNQTNFNIKLVSSTAGLDEVVVTAYGATRRQSFTGTASTIKAEKFKDLQVSSLTGVLQGNASGVLAVSSNGQPGENPTIRIRGIGSVNAASDPLILVDGAPYGGNINSLNPNDIESITVLKDASSTALYGSRAANGVLQIVTKSGRGTPRISVSALTGWSDRAVNDYEYTNSNQIYELTWEALKNEAIINPSLISATGSASAADYASKAVVGRLVYNPFGVAQPVGPDGKVVPGAQLLWNENWSDALLRTGVRKDYNVSVTGGNDRTRYYFSTGYLDDQGIAIESKFKRYTGRLKVDTKVNDWLSAGVNTNVVYSSQNYPAQGGSGYSNVIGWIHSVSSLYPQYLLNPANGSFILDANGDKQFDFGNNGPLLRPILTPGNPAGTTALNPTTYNRFTTSTNGYAEAEIIRGLKLRTQYVLDYYQFQENEYYNPFVGDGSAYGGRSYKGRDNSSTQTFTNTITYDKYIGTNHHVNFVGGMESYKYHEEDVAAEGRGFTFPGVTELDYAGTPYAASSSSYDNRLVSYFGRLNYDLNEKYHLSASLRADGSSRFADSVRWGTFYSVGGAWNVNKENFMAGAKWLSDLKLRASYGTTGNQLLGGYYPYLGTYGAGANIADYSGSIITQLANGNLTWEKQKTLDLGVDFAILKSRISGSFTYFTRTSEDLLFLRPLPPSVGIGGINDNIGTLKNSGVEIDLNTINISTKNFEWNTSFNLTHVKNEITELPQESIAGGGFSNLIVGQSLYNFYLREYAGVDRTDGNPMWYMDKKDAAGKVIEKVTTKTYSLATRYYEGTSLPDWTGGITNTIRYRSFDLTVLAAFSIGGRIYDADYAGLNYTVVGTTPGNNWTTDILGRWQSTTIPGDGITPKLTATTDLQGNSASTRFLYDASFTRIRNITLGFRVPKSLLDRAKINNARAYFNWQNPFTFFKRDGLDPEQGLSGVTSNTSSAYRTLSIGINFDL